MKNYKLVGLERRGELLLGLVLRQDDDKYDIYLECGEKAKIAGQKILHFFKTLIPADNEKNMKLGLKNARENFKEQSVDISMLWECLDADEDYSFLELAQAYFSELSDENTGALWVALSNDQHRLAYRNGAFNKISQELVEASLHRVEVEKQNRTLEENLLSWLQDAKPVQFDPQIEPAKKWLDALKKYALEGEEKAPAEAKRLASLLSLTPDETVLLLEQKGLLPKDINETIYRLGLTVEFPNAVLQETEKILQQSSPPPSRRCISNCWNIAIDDIETVEVDDAISYHQEDGYHVVGVHIADVAHTIWKDSELDRFASERFATLYFPEGKFFLFPEPLVQRLTLALGIARPAISGFFYFDSQGDLVKEYFEETLVDLKRRCSYEQTVPTEPIGQEPEFLQLQTIANQLREKRRQLGAVITEIPDLKVKVENDDVLIQPIPFYPGHLVVSELMILYNVALAKYLLSQKQASLFRVQGQPSYNLNEISLQDPLYPMKIRWALPAATLSLEPGAHYTLAAPAYVQATSPMRRYSDLVIQRQVKVLLNHQEPVYALPELQTIKVLMERTERLVKTAEHNRYLFWIHKYLKKNKGKDYLAYVSRLLENEKVMVFIPDLMQEFCIKPNHFDFQIGQKMLIRVQGASPRKKKARFEEMPLPMLNAS